MTRIRPGTDGRTGWGPGQETPRALALEGRGGIPPRGEGPAAQSPAPSESVRVQRNPPPPPRARLPQPAIAAAGIGIPYAVGSHAPARHGRTCARARSEPSGPAVAEPMGCHA
jgi:hypothetical protein